MAALKVSKPSINKAPKVTVPKPKAMAAPKQSSALIKNVGPSVSSFMNTAKQPKPSVAKGLKGYNQQLF